MRVILSSLLLASLTHATERPDWVALSRKLTGHSESARTNSLRDIRKIPRIQEILELELTGPRKFHALEVISALPLSECLPKLKELAALEPTGAIFLTINALADKANLGEIGEFYKATWEDKTGALSNPGMVAVLDTLGQMGICLTETSLAEVWGKRPAEVRLAILDYVDNSDRCGEFRQIRKMGHDDQTRQVRERAGGR